ncbi:MAG: DnaB-like helicase N-terminal domain-containing protein, partial [Acidobacteriota bacterium]
VEETLPFVRAVRSRIQKREYFDIAMDALRVQPDQRRELWQRIRSGGSTDAAAVQEMAKRSPASQPTVAEEKLLGLLLADEELRKIVLPRLDATDYSGLATSSIFRAVVKLDAEGREVSFDSMSQETADDSVAADLLPRLLMNESAESFDESMTTADSCVDALRLMKIDRQIDELSSEMAEAERAGEDQLRDRLGMELLQLAKQRGDFLPQAQTSKTVH